MSSAAEVEGWSKSTFQMQLNIQKHACLGGSEWLFIQMDILNLIMEVEKKQKKAVFVTLYCVDPSACWLPLLTGIRPRVEKKEKKT